MKNKSSKKLIAKIILSVILTIIILVGILALFSAKWYIKVYGDVGFDSILYTLLSDLNGTSSDLVFNFINNALIPTVLLTAVVCFLLFFKNKKKLELRVTKSFKLTLFPISRPICCVLAIALSLSTTLIAIRTVGADDYIRSVSKQSTVFEDYYVEPTSENVIFPEQKRNLIYIYLESMETTYMSTELTGAMTENLIPELTDLAINNINFSHNDSIGGFPQIHGTSHTVASLVSQTSGVPLKLPKGFSLNALNSDSFLPGLSTITDVLSDAGYYQAFMCGSDFSYANRDVYYNQHSIDRIYDYKTAKTDGIIPDYYYAWWGMEDKYVFEYAKQELLKISQQDQPFSFNLLTADTHHVGGYPCELCKNEYTEQYNNVIACSSRQVYNFIEWLEQQDFYDNTTIVIVGDHQTMDAEYMARNVDDNYTRHMYNCIINSAVLTENTKNRQFLATDMFPTTLAAMGCTIVGDRLGLGTNLFSESDTLAEQMGADIFSDELSKWSNYYFVNFYN